MVVQKWSSKCDITSGSASSWRPWRWRQHLRIFLWLNGGFGGHIDLGHSLLQHSLHYSASPIHSRVFAGSSLRKQVHATLHALWRHCYYIRGNWFSTHASFGAFLTSPCTKYDVIVPTVSLSTVHNWAAPSPLAACIPNKWPLGLCTVHIMYFVKSPTLQWRAY